VKQILIIFFNTLLIIFISLCKLDAQNITQVVRGKVSDALTGNPISDALVVLRLDDDQAIQATTDSNGTFRMANVEIGRYDLVVHHLSYRDQVFSGLQIEAGKEQVVEIELEESLRQLEEVVIEQRNPAPELISGYSLTVEQSERLAATFYDPARMVSSVAGVATSFDQANNIVVRGHSPASNQWWIEGLPVVSPNHLTNAGTFTDRPSLSGGGVSVVSAQLMANTHFMTGAFPARYGNALGGIFEIGLRNGNEENHEYTMQAGLLGIDLSAEGPFSPNHNASFLVNYRYSTIGLISALGVDVGDEEINFQDLAFNLHLEGKSGSWNLFGLGGLSHELFDASRDTAEWKGIEDIYDTRFSSDMGVIGIKHRKAMSSKLYWENGLALSKISSSREGFLVSPDFARTKLEDDEIQRQMISWQSNITWRVTASSNIEAGIVGINYKDQLYQEFSPSPEIPANINLDVEQNHFLFRPYLSSTWKIENHLEFKAGLGLNYHNLAKSAVPEPRIGITWQDDLSTISFRYALVSQIQSPGTYFTRINGTTDQQMPNANLEPTRSHQWAMSYSRMLSETFKLKSEVYYQRLFAVPISDRDDQNFSVLNVMEDYLTTELVNEGEGKNYGLEVTAEKYISNGFYFLGSGSMYEAKYTGSDGVERDTRFNGNYVFALSSGKEFYRQQKTRIWGVNLRSILQGGFRQAPINLEASQQQMSTIFDTSRGYTEQLDDYLRFDLRLSHTKHKSGYTRTWSLDIQNLTNQQNLAYRYFDPFLGEVVDKYQLGILPFISYRVEF